MVELSNIQKIIQILNSNEAKTWVHNNDADTGLAGSVGSHIPDPIAYYIHSGLGTSLLGM